MGEFLTSRFLSPAARANRRLWRRPRCGTPAMADRVPDRGALQRSSRRRLSPGRLARVSLYLPWLFPPARGSDTFSHSDDPGVTSRSSTLVIRNAGTSNSSCRARRAREHTAVKVTATLSVQPASTQRQVIVPLLRALLPFVRADRVLVCHRRRL